MQQRMMQELQVDREKRFANQDRRRDLKRSHGNEVTIFCSHDEKELEALQGSGAGAAGHMHHAHGAAGFASPPATPRPAA